MSEATPNQPREFEFKNEYKSTSVVSQMLQSDWLRYSLSTP